MIPAAGRDVLLSTHIGKGRAMRLSGLCTIGRRDHSGQRHGLRMALCYLFALSVIAGGLIVWGCSSDDNHNENEHLVKANLTNAQEVPPTSTTSAATGSVTLTIPDDRSHIDYTVTTVGPFTSPVLFAHIHVGQPSFAGPVILFFCTNQAPPAGVPVPQPCPTNGGTITGRLTAADFTAPAAAVPLGVSTFSDAITAILNNNTYSNVHTERNPGGEIRGQNIHLDTD